MMLLNLAIGTSNNDKLLGTSVPNIISLFEGDCKEKRRENSRFLKEFSFCYQNVEYSFRYGKQEINVYKYEKRLTEDDFKHQTLRKNLAIQEHSRWNAYMISRGFIPATRAQILKDKDGKDYDLRYHGNLTTMKGLIEFRELTGKDRINYDFHLMDQIWWYLNAFGYEIVKIDE